MSAILPRLAIGASWNPTTFDGTAILPLCYGDPDLPGSPTQALVRVGFVDSVEPLFDIREVAVLDAPRQLRRTGYGSRLTFSLELVFETAGSGVSLDPTDSSLFSLASLTGMTASGGTLAPVSGLSPPYLFLTTTYQTVAQQWIPVEIDPQASGSDLNQDFPLTKTWLRRIALRFVTQKVWRRIDVTYLSAVSVRQFAGVTAVASDGSSMTFNAAVPGDVVPGHWILARLAGQYGWFLFEILTIAGNRLSVTCSPKDGVPAAMAVPNYARVMVPDPYLRMPSYSFYTYPGGAGLPNPAFKALTANTQLIGGAI